MSELQMWKILVTFFDIKGIVHFKLIPQDHTVNQACYVQILKWLHEAVNRKGLELWPSDRILHYDSISAHKTLSVKQILAQKSITKMEHPPSSSDLALNDF
jgi:hypothetical protein